MQTVFDPKMFGSVSESSQSGLRALSGLKHMSAAESRLELQIFVGGLLVSGIMLLAMSVFGL